MSVAVAVATGTVAVTVAAAGAVLTIASTVSARPLRVIAVRAGLGGSAVAAAARRDGLGAVPSYLVACVPLWLALLLVLLLVLVWGNRKELAGFVVVALLLAGQALVSALRYPPFSPFSVPLLLSLLDPCRSGDEGKPQL